MSVVVSFDFDETLVNKIGTAWGGYYLEGIPESIELLEEYHALGCKCIIMTARRPSPEDRKEIKDFLKRQFIDHCIADIIYTSHEPKGPYAVDYGVNLHYDDKDDHLESVRGHGIQVVDSKWVSTTCQNLCSL